MKSFDFSLVTTCRNEILSFESWKQDVLGQTRKPSEILVVDAFSNDGTAEKLFKWSAGDPKVRIIQEKGSPAQGRNTAISKAKYEIILSTDMGVRLSKKWCEELITPFEKDFSLEVVAGSTSIDFNTLKSPISRSEYFYENGGIPKLMPGFIPGNRSVAYTKKVWEKLGGLPEDLTFAADDSVFGRQMVQLGIKIAYAPKALTFWERPNKLIQFYNEQFVYGRGDGEAFIKTPLAFKWYLEKKIPFGLILLLHPIFQLLKSHVYHGIIRAIKKGDLMAAFYIPLLIAGRSFYFIKGYKLGYNHGRFNCLSCRKRLNRDFKGYSLL